MSKVRPPRGADAGRVRPRRHRLRRAIAAATLVGGTLGLTAIPASAAVTTDFTGGVLTITGDGANDTITVAHDGTNITLNGNPITGGPTLTNTTDITIDAGAGDDDVTIDASSGLFAPGAGPDDEITITIQGSGGNDAFDLIFPTSGDTFDLGASGMNFNGDTDLDGTLSGLESGLLLGGPGIDVLNAGGSTVTGSPFSLFGFEIEGAGGGDTLTGGTGNDFFPWFDGDGNDTVTGGMGDDLFLSSLSQLGNDIDVSANGELILFARTNGSTFAIDVQTDDVSALMGPGADTFTVNDLTGVTGVNVVGTRASGGDDTVDASGQMNPNIEIFADGMGGNDTLQGGAGPDTLIGAEDGDSVNGNGGPDSIPDDFDELLEGPNTNDTLMGGGDADTLEGGLGANLMDGGSDDDLLVSNGAGNDTSIGGPGHDTARVFGTPGPDSFSLRPFEPSIPEGILVEVLAPDGKSIVLEWQEIDFGDVRAGNGDDSLTVDPFIAQVMREGMDVDMEGGADIIIIEADIPVVRLTPEEIQLLLEGTEDPGFNIRARGYESARVTGDEGRNIFDASAFTDEVPLRGAGGTAAVPALTLDGGGGKDVLLGSPQADDLLGGGGKDKLVGGEGPDKMLGQGGKDTFKAKDGTKDVINGGPGKDRAKTDKKDKVRKVEKRK